MQFSFNSFNSFNPFQDQENCKITVQLGTTIIQQVSVPLFAARTHFTQLVKQASGDSRPLQVKCVCKEYTESDRELENSLAFENKSFIEAFGEKGE